MIPRLVLIVFIGMSSVYSWSQKIDDLLLDEKQAVTMLKEFYTAYLTEWDHFDESGRPVSDAVRKKYCEQVLLRKIDHQKEDYDLLINAQDTHVDLLSTLEITRDKQRLDVYRVDLYKGENPVFLKVLKVDGHYKIADVLY